jgi:hypothetical protein
VNLLQLVLVEEVQPQLLALDYLRYLVVTEQVLAEVVDNSQREIIVVLR